MSSSTTEVFAAEQASKLLGRLASQIARTLKRHSAKEVHDLRVAIRRFMCVLVVLKPCFPRNESRKIRRKLKKIMAQAGGVRDRDIAVQLIGKVAPSQASPLVRGVRAERDEAAEALTVSLKRWEGRNLFTKWREALEGESSMKEFGADPVDATAKRMLPRMAKEYFRSGKDAARENASDEELHRFRIAGKKFRYTLDLFAPLYGASTNGLIQQLKAIQTLLGEINDCATVQRMVSHQKAGRQILAALEKRQGKKAQQFRNYWAGNLSGAAVIRQWTDILRHALALRTTVG